MELARKQLIARETENGPFSLPKTIARTLKKVADSHAALYDAQSKLTQDIEYLWINVADEAAIISGRGCQAFMALTSDEWLNVVDEAASLGVNCIIVRVSTKLSKCPGLWKVCQWAQDALGMFVGIYITHPKVSKGDAQHLADLDPGKTWVCFDSDIPEATSALKEHNIQFQVATPSKKNHCATCRPDNIVFVSPEGLLYTCGLVKGEKNYCMGSVLEKPISNLLHDKLKAKGIPEGAIPQGRMCEACPPILAESMFRRLMAV